MWAVFVCFPLFAFCQLFNSSAAQWSVLFRIFESLKQYLLLATHICSFCQLLFLVVKTHSWHLLRYTIFSNDICETQKTQSSLHNLSLFSTTPFSKDFSTQREKFLPACIDRTRKDSTQTSSDKERCRPLLTEEPKTADNGIKNCWQKGEKTADERKNWRNWSKKLATDEPGGTKKARQEKKWTARGWVCWLRLQFVCVFHRSMWQHSFCKERIKCTPISVMNQDSIIHAGTLKRHIKSSNHVENEVDLTSVLP